MKSTDLALAASVFFFSAATNRPAAAEIYRPWCAQYYGFHDGSINCGFVSYEQCMMTAQGAGAYCVQNPWYLQYGPGRGTDAPPPPRRRPRR